MVQCEVEKPPVNGHEQAAPAQSAKAADRPFRAHVHIGPERVRGSNLEHGEIERAKLFANIAEAVPFSRVSTVIDTVPGAGKSERRPECLKPVEEASTRKVTGRQGRYDD